jgi:hypothetical protein
MTNKSLKCHTDARVAAEAVGFVPGQQFLLMAPAVVHVPAHVDLLGMSKLRHLEHVREERLVDENFASCRVEAAVDSGAARLPAVIDSNVVAASGRHKAIAVSSSVANKESANAQRERVAAAGGEWQQRGWMVYT